MAGIGEMLEVIGDMGDDGGIFGALDSIDTTQPAAQATAEASWSAFAENAKFGGIGENMGDFKPEITRDGRFEFTNAETGKSFRVDEIKSAYTDGDYKTIFDKFGVDTSDPEAKEFLERQKAGVEQEPGVQARNAAGDAEASGEGAEKAGAKEPRGGTPKEIEESMKEELKKMGSENTKKIDDAVKRMDKQIKEGRGSEKKWGRWLKTGLFLGAVGFGLYEFYEQVKKHQAAANGCWLVHNNGSKCKIKPLTCDRDSRDPNNDDFTICGYCGDEGKCTRSVPATFNPCIAGSSRKGGGVMPGEYDPASKDPGKACTVCSACAIQCSSGTCDPNCGCEKFNCPVNYKIVCVNMSFWGAASDLVQEPFVFAESSLIKILKILAPVCLAIIAIIAIFSAGRFMLNWGSDSRGAREKAKPGIDKNA